MSVPTTARRSSVFPWLAWCVLAFSNLLRSQEPPPFPGGINGELYLCPRIDQNPAKFGGPLTVALDGYLDESAWERAAFHKWTKGVNEYWKGGSLPENEADADWEWAAVADAEFLYVAWRVVDETLKSGSNCGAWNDDAMEIYFDGIGDGIDSCCPGYGLDDFQLIIGAGNRDHDADPDLLNSGYLRAGGCVREGSLIDTFRGVVLDLVSEEGSSGWQGEIAIALDTMDRGEWSVDPSNGTVIGFDMHLDDDDHDGGQDATTSALIWSRRDPNSRAWQTPGVFGKLQFFDFAKPVMFITRDLPENLHNGDTGTVTLTLDAQFGAGPVIVKEELPPGILPSNPTSGGTVAGQTITWNLGTVGEDMVLRYDIQVTELAVDGLFTSSATIDGEPIRVLGDLAYSGSPFNILGFIKLWNHLGPLAFSFPAAANDHGPPGACDALDPATVTAQLPLDWIVNADGTVTEASILPQPGMLTRPEYGGDGLTGGTGARAAGLVVEPGDTGLVVRDRFPVWRGTLSPTDTIDHASAGVNGIDADDHLTMSCVYITNHTGQAVTTLLGLGSDDSIQVLVNAVDVTQGGFSICRPWGQANEDQDTALVTLPEGESRILVKVTDGGGASGFRLRFQDPGGDPALPGLRAPEFTVSLESARNRRPGNVARALPRTTFGLNEAVDVSLSADLAPAADLTIREVLPAGAGADSISDGGTVAGGVVEWRLNGAAQKTVSYRVVPDPCAGDMTFGQSSFQVGPFEYLVGGPDRLTRTYRDEPLGAWDSRDLNAQEGSVEKLGDHDVVIKGAGDGVQFTADSFRFVSLPRSDDFEFSARIDCLDDPGGAGQAGLMVRDTFDAHAAHAFFFLGSPPPAGGLAGTLKGLFRPATKPSSSVRPVAINQKDVLSLPLYLKIKRTGSKLSFQRAADGTAFTEVATKDIGTGATQVNLGANTLVGLAVNGGGRGSTRVRFSEVSPPSFGEPPGKRFRRGDVDASGTIDISDPIGTLTFLFLGGAAPACADAADTDDSGLLDITDAVNELGFLFLGGVAPADPGPLNCGLDSKPETPELGCEQACP